MPSEPRVAASAEVRQPGLRLPQILWLALLHWPGTGVVLFAAASGLPVVLMGPTDVETLLFVGGIGCATIASVLGTAMATVIYIGGASNVAFDRGTTTSRVIAFTLLAAFVIFAAGLLVDEQYGSTTDIDDLTQDIVETALFPFLSVGSLLAVVGPGFSEYREARAKSASDQPAPGGSA